MDEIIKRNNEMLKMALQNIKPIKEGLEKTLRDDYSDEVYEKLIVLNKEIEKAEKLIDATAKEGIALYAEYHPDNVTNGEINAKGIKRLGFLEKKWGFIRFFKK